MSHFNQRISFDTVEGIRVGKIPNKINTTCIIYRINDLLVDTGPTNQWKLVKKFIEEKELKKVLITHHHEDHSGNGFNIKNDFTSEIYASEKTIEKCKNGFKVEFYRRYAWGKPKTFEPIEVEEDIEINSIILKPIKTPGHSDDMTCYIEKNKGWLFTGDLLISSKPKYMRKDENPLEEMESIKELLKLDFETVFCAHKGIVQNGKKALEDKLNYLNELKESILELHNKGFSRKEIRLKLFGKEDLLTILTYYNFSKLNIVDAFLR